MDEDDGNLSDDESTDTAASDVVNDTSLPVSSAVLSDVADKQDTDDNSIKDSISPSVPSKPPSGTVAVSPKSDRNAGNESVRDKPLLETASLPMVRLERLSLEATGNMTSEAGPVDMKQTPVAEHNYFLTVEPPTDDRQESRTSRESHPSRSTVDSDNSVDVGTEPPAPAPSLPPSIALDHCYCVPFLPSDAVLWPPAKTAPERKTKRRPSDVTNLPGFRELSSILPPAAIPPPRPQYQPRDLKSEIMTLLEFILGGVDAEDIMFLQRRYEQLLQFDSAATDWLNDTHWVDHPKTFFVDPAPQPPPRKRRKVDMREDQLGHHLTGWILVFCLIFQQQLGRFAVLYVCCFCSILFHLGDGSLF